MLYAHFDKDLDADEMSKVKDLLKIRINKTELEFKNEEIINLMINDKKNNHGKINFSLLVGIGKCNYDYKVNAVNIEKSLNFYRNLNAQPNF